MLRLNPFQFLQLLFIGVIASTFLLSINTFAMGKTSYENYMQQLIALAKKKNPRYPFAAMIVDNQTGKILCEGVFEPKINPTYHGEMVAINNCLKKYPHFDGSKTTLITDAEPCAMCTGAIVWVGIPRIVYGTSVPFFVEHHWTQINVRAEYIIQHSPFYKGMVMGGVLHLKTDKLFADAYTKMQ